MNFNIFNNLHIVKKWIRKRYTSLYPQYTDKKLRNLIKKNELHYNYNIQELKDSNVYLYWWNDILDNMNNYNIGDYLSLVVVSSLMPSNKKSNINHTILAIGSVIGFGVLDSVVWGSGLLNYEPNYLANAKFSNYNIRAVRGPKTRKLLRKIGIKCPKVYGDPAVLMPLIYQPLNLKKEYDVTIIPHHARPIDIPDNLSSYEVLSTLTTDYKYFIDQIVKSNLVISGSLHGIILAEAYGVPAILILKKGDNAFKYKDYYYSTGRKKIVIAHSVEEALSLNPMTLPSFELMRENLLKAFPYDLWEQ